MARVFISGSSTGLGLMAAELLVKQGHTVVLHGRNQARSAQAKHALPEAESVATGDLSTVRGMRSIAEQLNRLGRFDGSSITPGSAIASRSGSRPRMDCPRSSPQTCLRLMF